MIEGFLMWLAKRLAPYTMLYLQVGGHCGICGKWVSDVLVERSWSWTLCEVCKNVTEDKTDFT